MLENKKQKLKQFPRVQCFKCGSFKSYTNPVSICAYCKNKFCYDHIYGSFIPAGSGENQVIQDICEKCLDVIPGRLL